MNMLRHHRIEEKFTLDARIVVHPGECLDLLRTIPDEAIQLVVTSPPYNLGKEYERRIKVEDLPAMPD